MFVNMAIFIICRILLDSEDANDEPLLQGISYFKLLGFLFTIFYHSAYFCFNFAIRLNFSPPKMSFNYRQSSGEYDLFPWYLLHVILFLLLLLFLLWRLTVQVIRKFAYTLWNLNLNGESRIRICLIITDCDLFIPKFERSAN